MLNRLRRQSADISPEQQFLTQNASNFDPEKDIVWINGEPKISPELLAGIREMEDYLIDLGHMAIEDRLKVPDSMGPSL